MRQKTLTQDQKNKLIQKHSYIRPSSYIGPDYYETISVVGQSRDSDCLERSNFRVSLELLGGESEDVMVIRDSHWGVGWIETLRVNKSNSDKMEIALQILASLEDYPVLSDDDFSELENDERIEWAEQAKTSVAQVLINVFGLPEELGENEEFLSICCELNIEHQYECGNDSALMDNPYHTTDLSEYDTEAYIRAIEGTLSNHGDFYKNNESFKLIAACFGVEIE